MKTSIIGITTAVIFLLCLPAAARLDETPAQCNQRYGAPVREIAGNNGVVGARIYNNQGMEIIAIFVTRVALDPKVGMILYNNNTNSTTRLGAMQTEVESQLLSTLPGRWEPYTAPQKLGSSTQGRQIQPATSQLEQRRMACQTAVDTVASAVYPLFVYPGYSRLPPDVGHNGNDKFAFRVPSGLAIVSSDAIPAIQKWSATLPRRTTKPAPPPTKDLSGF